MGGGKDGSQSADDGIIGGWLAVLELVELAEEGNALRNGGEFVKRSSGDREAAL